MEELHPHYETLLAIAACRDEDLKKAYWRLRELVEECCATQIAPGSLQTTDLAARLNYLAAKLRLGLSAQNRLHTFRLTSNAILNRAEAPRRESLLRDAKTVAFLVQHLTGIPVPEPLKALLPRADATFNAFPPAVRREKRMRVFFLSRDETFLYVRPRDFLTDKPLRVRWGIDHVNAEFNETCARLWPNASINLLDVGIDHDGILTPSFIVLEPDYLLDISSLAECFQDHGHHPANYVLARLSIHETSASMLVGNIANLFLDEWIFSATPPDYRECMQKAFRTYPLELVTCAELREPSKEREFFLSCRAQFDHIGRTVEETFRQEGYRLDKHDAVVEPSYLCEALGVHGRLDYMQRDMKAFIEMKSGKAEEYKVPGRYLPKEKHLVQMQLYQAVLEYSMGQDHHRTRPYLLYSRYPLLYPARPSWALLRRVINVRNGIVANEHDVQQQNDPVYTADFFARITPEALNEHNLGGKLWSNYLLPRIKALPEALGRLSATEQAYFFHVYNFITRELYTAKSGDASYENNRGAASLWLSTTEEKQDAGEILTDLRLVENLSADEQQPTVRLERTGGAGEGLPNFRRGDAVVLYAQAHPEDNATNQMLFKAGIEDISDREICLRLRIRQRNAHVLPPHLSYVVERDCMDTTFNAMYQGLARFLRANPERRDLLLGRRQPRHDAGLDAAIAREPDPFRRIALKARAALDYFLLIGPPGTGKTSHALRLMVSEFLSDGKQLLLLSYTNRAVDEMCKMLETMRERPDYIRIGSANTCEPAYHHRLLSNVLRGKANRAEVRLRLENCPIYVATVATLSARSELFGLKRFDVALIDEATQILEPQLLGILCAKTPSGADAVGKFVLIGDHKQLPAVVMQDSRFSEVADPRLRAIGLHNLKDSLFERLYRRVDDPACRDMLCLQGRMHPAVADFANHAFYEGRLLPVGLPHQQGELSLAPGLQGTDMADLLLRRVAFLPAVEEPSMGSAKCNHSEARLVARLAAAVYRQYKALGDFAEARTLGIITPYRRQIALIRREIALLGIGELSHITVDTVERFQGSERDVIIYSFCVNRPSQLRFLSNLTEDRGVLIDRKLNVALTRARKQLFLVGVPRLLRLNPIYDRLLRSVSPSL